LNPTTSTTHVAFDFDVVTDHVGNRLLVINKPSGDQHVFPFGEEAAKTLSEKLVAQKVKVYREMPNGGRK